MKYLALLTALCSSWSFSAAQEKLTITVLGGVNFNQIHSTTNADVGGNWETGGLGTVMVEYSLGDKWILGSGFKFSRINLNANNIFFELDGSQSRFAIPVLVNYTLKKGSFLIIPYMGPELNFVIDQSLRGEFLDGSLEEQASTHRKTIISYLGGIQIRRVFGERFISLSSSMSFDFSNNYPATLRTTPTFTEFSMVRNNTQNTALIMIGVGTKLR